SAGDLRGLKRTPAPGRRICSGAGVNRQGSAVADVRVVPGVGPRVDLARAADPRLGVLDHLAPLRDPTGQTADREEHGEHIRRESECLVDQTRVEVHVRVELALDEVVIGQGDLLELLSQLGQRVPTGPGEDLISGLLDYLRAGAVVRVDAVTEA